MDPAIEPIAQRMALPCRVPEGGMAILVSDHGILRASVIRGPADVERGSGESSKVAPWAVVFPRTRWRTRFDVGNLRSAEGALLELRVGLALSLEDPERLVIDIVRDAQVVEARVLEDLLASTLSGALGRRLQRREIADLADDGQLGHWLQEAVAQALGEEFDLRGRSGLAVGAIEISDLRCQVWNSDQEQAESRYFCQVTHASAPERAYVDAQVLKWLQLGGAARGSRRRRRRTLREWVARTRSAPSVLRPELWRRGLGTDVSTAPLSDGACVYVVDRLGELHALDADTGESPWPSAVSLSSAPASAMALVEETLWIPTHGGVLYGVDRRDGRIRYQVPIGGRLSSAPTVHEGRLYLSVDVDAHGSVGAAGRLVAVDPADGRVVNQWLVSGCGLRAQPAALGQKLYVGDRRGGFYALDPERGLVEPLPVRGGRILAAATADEARGQIIIGTGFSQVLVLDEGGALRWSQRLPQSAVGRPLLHRDRVIVGCGDGLVYAFDAQTGQPVWPNPFATRGPIAADPVAWGALAFVGSNDGYLYAIDVETGECFWQYNSGSAVFVPPAVAEEGSLFVVDAQGHLNALRWCLSQYAEGARRLEAMSPPRWAQAVDLWLAAGALHEAFQAAERSEDEEMVAELALGLDWYQRAAEAFEELARRSRSAKDSADWWSEAAKAWDMHGDEGRARHCRLQDAMARSAPYLVIEQEDLPQLTVGVEEDVTVRIRNLADAVACEVVLAYAGHVPEAGEMSLGAIGPQNARSAVVTVAPTRSGSARLSLDLRYKDLRGIVQEPVQLQVRLGVARSPTVIEQHFNYGNVIRGDGVIIDRGQGAGRRRLHLVDEGLDMAAENARMNDTEDGSAASDDGRRRCPDCGSVVEGPARYCPQCSREL